MGLVMNWWIIGGVYAAGFILMLAFVAYAFERDSPKPEEAAPLEAALLAAILWPLFAPIFAGALLGSRTAKKGAKS